VKRLRQWWTEKVSPLWDRYQIVISFAVTMALTLTAIIFFAPSKSAPRTVSISQYFTDVRTQQVKEVELNNAEKQATVALKNGQEYVVAYPDDVSQRMFDAADAAGVPFKVVGKGWTERYQLLIWLMVVTLMLMLVLAQMASSLKKKNEDQPPAIDPTERPEQRFKDVGGADEVIANIEDVVKAFTNADSYKDFGVKPINGLLLKGPPGTGKTLLARAIAGEAGAAFYAVNGTDFMGRWLNDGPRAVKELFHNLRAQGGGILFIDEIDAIAAKRSSNDDSGSKELNNTLMALLTEMDGFNTATQVPILVIGATNRPDDLDQGIVRRFKIQEEMPTPGPSGRRAILEIHLSAMGAVANNLPLERLVSVTSGMTGDDIAAIVNQAGLLALKQADGDVTKAKVTFEHLMEALDTKQLGSARHSRVLSEKDKLRAAIHEAGHALAAYFTVGAPRPTRLTIVPRGTSGGHTRVEDDLTILTLEELQARLVFYMGGRAAERLVESVITTSATSDIEQATAIARRMVCDMGMGEFTAQVPQGRESGVDTFREIDKLVREAEEEALQVLERHRTELDQLTERLLREETLDGNVLQEMFGATV
jgi:cell division protease FtsH